MMIEILTYVLIGTGLVCALIGGIFLGFSDFLMRGFQLATPRSGIEAMQGLNRTVLKSLFLSNFLAMVPASMVLTIFSFMYLNDRVTVLLGLACAGYLSTVFFVTAFGNVPMNKKLEGMSPDTKEAEDYWKLYIKNWTRWNHVRTCGSVFSAVCYLLAATTL